MANLTIENIGNTFRSGNVDSMIDGSTQVQTPEAPEINLEAAQSTGGRSFLDMVKESLDKVNADQLQADRAAKELVAGRNKNIHETMLMMEKADMSFKLMMQVRNKVIDAYREIMRMQV